MPTRHPDVYRLGNVAASRSRQVRPNSPTDTMNATESHNLASNLLAWYREMGVDAVVSDEAIDWLNRGDTKPGAGYVLPQVADPR